MTPIDPFRDRLREHARATRCRIIFTDGDNPQVIEAALKLQAEALVYPILISRGAVLEIECIYPGSSPQLSGYAAYLHQQLAAQNLSEADADSLARKPLYFGILAVACGDADGCIAGEAQEPGESQRSTIIESLLQGLPKPVNRVRPGAPTEEIYTLASVIASQIRLTTSRS